MSADAMKLAEKIVDNRHEGDNWWACSKVLATALLAMAEQVAKMERVVEAARELAEVSDFSYAGPGQYKAAGASLRLRDAFEALDDEPTTEGRKP